MSVVRSFRLQKPSSCQNQFPDNKLTQRLWLERSLTIEQSLFTQINLIFSDYNMKPYANKTQHGSGCGSVGRVDASDTRDLLFEYSHLQTFTLNMFNC